MTTWKLDPTHTHIQFAVRHMMVATVKGSFERFAADASIDLTDLTKSKVTATAEVASVNTGEAQRDGHLKSPDFFDAENHPQLTLVTQSIKKSGDDVEIVADLTIRGVTKPITLKGELLGPAKDPWGNQRVGVSVTGEVEREDFGLKWNQALEAGGVLVGKKVKLALEAEFIQQ